VKVFILQRDKDISGISGIGVVAEGVEFDDGKVALRWIVGEHKSSVVWDSMADVEAVHGHEGATAIIWLGEYAVH
jgi:hypothetical protein